jgi:hypothetical protein
MTQITRTVAERPDAPFSDILDNYRNDLIQRNVYSLELRCDPEYSDMWPVSYFRDNWPLYDITSVRVLNVTDGNGRHKHDDQCAYGCMREHDDSDWVVTLAYDELEKYGQNRTHQAVYGVIDGNFALWLD